MVNVNLTGRFLAELTKEVFSDLEASKYQVCYSFITCFLRAGTSSSDFLSF